MRAKHCQQLEGCGFELHPMQDGNVVQVMSGLILTHNPGSIIKKKMYTIEFNKTIE